MKNPFKITFFLLFLGFSPWLQALAEKPSSPSQKLYFAFIGVWDRAKPILERASRQTGISVSFYSIQEFLDAYSKNDPPFQTVFVLNLRPQWVSPFVSYIHKIRNNRSFHLLSLDHRDSQLPLKKAGLLIEDPKIRRYWKYNGFINLQRLLKYTANQYCGIKVSYGPPVVIPDYGLYHPDSKKLFSSTQVFLQWYQKRFGTIPKRRVFLLIHQSFWITEDTKVIQALIRGFQKENILCVAGFGDTTKRIYSLIRPFQPSLILLQVHVALTEGSRENDQTLQTLGVPFLKPISLLGATVEEWEKDPRGLNPQDVGLHLTVLETMGMIEPNVVGGLEARTFGFRVHRPISERIRHFIRRAIRWMDLQSLPNKEKRIAVIYYNKYLGKSDILRGSPTGAYLDGPKSLLRLLRTMKKSGYTIPFVPKNEKELLSILMKKGRNIAPWAQGELRELVLKGNPALIPLSLYQKWFQKIPEKLRNEIIKHFGPPPGRLMVADVNGSPHIVIPRVQLGNLLLLPQPVRGDKVDEKLLHSRSIPPSHNYLAFYFYIRKVFRAHAVLHFGTHGTLELLPLKASGLSSEDYGDLLLGDLPNIYPWILDNLGEATLAKRRSYAVLIDHLVPPVVQSGIYGELKELHNEIDKFDSLEDGILKEEFRKSILKKAIQLHLFQDRGLQVPKTLSDKEIHKLAEYLHEIHNETSPKTLHVLGEILESKALIGYITSILGRRFLKEMGKDLRLPQPEEKGERLKIARKWAEKYLQAYLLQGKKIKEFWDAKIVGPLNPKRIHYFERARRLYQKFQKTPMEIQNILLALKGGFIPPGSGNDPVRNPASLPTGRNMFAVNPEEIPVKPAWETGKILVDQLLKKEKELKGRYPKKIGFDLNGHETMRHFGVTESEILYLMGVEPVWNENHLVVDVKVIPKDKLGRPRIDVFIAMGGVYRDNFPSRVMLLDKAVRLVSALKEKENYLREFSLALEKKLLQKGFSQKRARFLSKARIFGAKPGEFGTRILHLIPRSGVWDKVDEVTSVYTDTMSYLYTKGEWGVPMKALYSEAIQGTEVILRTWSSHMTSPLTNHHFYEYLGGLNLAVRSMCGKTPRSYVSDVRHKDTPKVESFSKVIQREFRVRLFNPSWIRGMMKNHYAGAGQMAELVKNTFGWQVTIPKSIRQDNWKSILDIYLKDKYKLGLNTWFSKVNPYARQEITATLLEASRKGYFKPSKKDLDFLAHE
ncbi:MAG: cobaltochelatase subunit CobN, partial [Planctomycetota bacterium]